VVKPSLAVGGPQTHRDPVLIFAAGALPGLGAAIAGRSLPCHWLPDAIEERAQALLPFTFQ
jgi:hypothetical protein